KLLQLCPQRVSLSMSMRVELMGMSSERTFSSLRSYGRLATITLVLEGMPSSGGPRCLGVRVRGLESLESLKSLVSLGVSAGAVAGAVSLVTSAKGTLSAVVEAGGASAFSPFWL